jgi:hypothetical protein
MEEGTLQKRAFVKAWQDVEWSANCREKVIREYAGGLGF